METTGVTSNVAPDPTTDEIDDVKEVIDAINEHYSVQEVPEQSSKGQKDTDNDMKSTESKIEEHPSDAPTIDDREENKVVKDILDDDKTTTDEVPPPTLQRRSQLQRNIRPGAVSVTSSGAMSASVDSNTVEDDVETANPTVETSTLSVEGHLVSAELVDEKPEQSPDVVTATATPFSKQFYARKRVFVGSLVLVVLGFLVVGLSVGLSINDRGSTSEGDFTKDRNAIIFEEVVGPKLTEQSKAALQMQGSPQRSALQWLIINHDLEEAVSEEQIVQRYALATLYYATGGDSWIMKQGNNWLTPTLDECSWNMNEEFGEAIEPCVDGEFHELVLNDAGLYGTLPDDVFLLSNLVDIDLSHNFLHGTIPSTFGNLKRVEVFVADSNQFTGPLPNVKSEDMLVVQIQHNLLSGTIPEYYGSLSNLEVLALSVNRNITGPVPEGFGDLEFLEWLNLPMTGITGTIPDSLCDNFGEISVECDIVLCSCCECNSLLGGNLENFYENVFVLLSEETREQINEEGSSPKQAMDWLVENHDLDSMPTHRIIQRFVLALLYFETQGVEWTSSDGWVDETLTECEWSHKAEGRSNCDSRGVWKDLRLFDNKLNGELPDDLALLDKLEYIDFGNNFLKGTIPNTVTSLSNLGFLSVAENSMSGSMPHSYSPSIDAILFEKNSLSGTVPASLANATSLTHVILEGNPNLYGTIPSALGALPSLESLLLHGTNVTKVPDDVCNGLLQQGLRPEITADCDDDGTVSIVCNCCTCPELWRK